MCEKVMRFNYAGKSWHVEKTAYGHYIIDGVDIGNYSPDFRRAFQVAIDKHEHK